LCYYLKSQGAFLTISHLISERREMATQSLPAVSLRTGNRLPDAQVLIRGVNYLICMALWLVGSAISGLEPSFLPALREAPRGRCDRPDRASMQLPPVQLAPGQACFGQRIGEGAQTAPSPVSSNNKIVNRSFPQYPPELPPII